MSWFGWTGEISGQKQEEQRDVRPPWCWGTSWPRIWGQGPKTVSRACRGQGLDLSGVGPTPGLLKG